MTKSPGHANIQSQAEGSPTGGEEGKVAHQLVLSNYWLQKKDKNFFKKVVDIFERLCYIITIAGTLKGRGIYSCKIQKPIKLRINKKENPKKIKKTLDKSKSLCYNTTILKRRKTQINRKGNIKMFDVSTYIDTMEDTLYDAVLAALETDGCEEVAKRFDIPVAVAKDLSWFWVTD